MHKLLLVPGFVLGFVFAASALASAPAATAPQAAASTAKEQRTNCLKETGSHIKPKEGECIDGVPGTVITREEIDRSGAVNVGDAVRKLVPSAR
jgi:uncharacterized low-complexity protein